MTRHSHVLALAAIMLTSCGAEASRTAGHISTSGGVSGRDRAWLETIHQAGLADPRTGGLAEKKGGSLALRRAGSMLAVDHARFDAAVVRVANRLGVALPRTAGAAQIDVTRRLADEAGGRFDRDFVDTTVAGHRAAIADTKAEVREGTSPEVTDLAREALPMLRAHLTMLESASPSS